MGYKPKMYVFDSVVGTKTGETCYKIKLTCAFVLNLIMNVFSYSFAYCACL